MVEKRKQNAVELEKLLNEAEANSKLQKEIKKDGCLGMLLILPTKKSLKLTIKIDDYSDDRTLTPIEKALNEI